MNEQEIADLQTKFERLVTMHNALTTAFIVLGKSGAIDAERFAEELEEASGQIDDEAAQGVLKVIAAGITSY